MFDHSNYADYLRGQAEAAEEQKAAGESASDAPAGPDPASPEWEAAQPRYALCTPEQHRTLFHLRDAIRTAFASPLGQIRRKPQP